MQYITIVYSEPSLGDGGDDAGALGTFAGMAAPYAVEAAVEGGSNVCRTVYDMAQRPHNTVLDCIYNVGRQRQDSTADYHSTMSHVRKVAQTYVWYGSGRSYHLGRAYTNP